MVSKYKSEIKLILIIKRFLNLIVVDKLRGEIVAYIVELREFLMSM